MLQALAMGPMGRRGARRVAPVLALVVGTLAWATASVLVAAAPASAKTVTVGRGDTLTSIAARNHTTVAALAAANGIGDPNRILAGALLQLPDQSVATASAPGPGPSANAPGAPGTVTVGRGDTLTSIAARNHTTVAALAAANGIRDPNRILAGTVLRLPASSMSLASYSTPISAGSPGGGGPANPGVLPSQLRAHPARMTLFPLFEQAAAASRVPVDLLEAMCWWESGWQAGVVSSSGAVGVCQLEPATTQFVDTNLLHASLDPNVAADNIRLGAAYLAYLLGQTDGNQQLALAGYYAGLASVLHHGLSPATSNYVTGILAYARIFAAAG